MSASHQAYRHARLERLLDDPNLLRRCPTPTALNRCDDLNSIRRVGHRHGCMPHTCQVGDHVRSVRGLSHYIYVADLNATALNWCVERYRCKAVIGDLPLTKFDLVWLGSVFTHLPEHAAKALLQEMKGCVCTNGVLIFSSQGRYSAERLRDWDWSRTDQPWVHYGLERKLMNEVLLGYHDSGLQPPFPARPIC